MFFYNYLLCRYDLNLLLKYWKLILLGIYRVGILGIDCILNGNFDNFFCYGRDIKFCDFIVYVYKVFIFYCYKN